MVHRWVEIIVGGSNSLDLAPSTPGTGHEHAWCQAYRPWTPNSHAHQAHAPSASSGGSLALLPDRCRPQARSLHDPCPLPRRDPWPRPSIRRRRSSAPRFRLCRVSSSRRSPGPARATWRSGHRRGGAARFSDHQPVPEELPRCLRRRVRTSPLPGEGGRLGPPGHDRHRRDQGPGQCLAAQGDEVMAT